MKIIGFLEKKEKSKKIKLKKVKFKKYEQKQANTPTKRPQMGGKLFRNVVANCIIGVVLVFMFTLTYAGGTLNAFSSNQPTAIYNGNLNSNKICLMINVYWGNECIEPMLATLEEYNVKTTFFLGGMWVEKYADLALKIYESGHEIANHGYFHKDQDKINLDANKKEILSCHNIIKNKLNIEMNLFAPPSGAYSNDTIKAAEQLNYKVIMWTRDTIDWRDRDATTIYNRAVKNAKGGDLILMHPTSATAEALPQIIQTLQSENFTLTTVSSCLS